MRVRLICVALAGLAVLATTAASPAATQSFWCTDTTAVTSHPLITANCGIDVTCPALGECIVSFESLGNGFGLIDARVYIQGVQQKSCRGLFSCRTSGFSTFSGGDTVFVSVFVGGVPAAALTEARLTVRVSPI